MPIEIELYQFERSKVWHLVPKQIDITVIVKKWTFRNKLDEHRTITRNKSRLVVQGYNQHEGIDFDEILSYVARMEVIRILIKFVAHKEFKLFQIDVKSALLNANMKDEVYVKQTPDLNMSNCSIMC